MLTVIGESENQDLATLAAVKAALGIADISEDRTLPSLISQASAAISMFCNRIFIEETVEETFRLDGRTPSLVLSRYPVTEIVSITEAGIAVEASGYEVDMTAGVISRLWSDRTACWATGKTVVQYSAGFPIADVPRDLVQALVQMVAQYRSQAGRDPLVKSMSIPGIADREYFIPTADGMPGPVEVLISAHRKMAGA